MARGRERNRLGVIAGFIFAMTPFVFLGCGSSAEYTVGSEVAPVLDPAVDVSDEATADETKPAPEEIAKLGSLDKTEALILSPAYDGALVVHLEESPQNFVKGQTPKTFSIESVIAGYPQAKLSPFLDTDPVQLDKRRKELERLSGKKMPDWNSVFVVEIAEQASAVRLFRELRDLGDVGVVYPRQKPVLLSLETTPDLAGQQGYLYPEATHGGLNAMAAWGEGVTGADVVILDAEIAWNFEHEDLPIGSGRLIGTLDCATPGSTGACLRSTNHGSGVVGIMGGLNNEHGVTGVAYDSEVYAFSYDGEGLAYLTDGAGDTIGEEIPPGSVVAIELGAWGALSDPMSGSQYGGLPAEVMRIDRDAILSATTAGVTVVEGAGNGSISLDDPSVYLPTQFNPSSSDSGSIMVGGSYGTGHDHRRPPELNCGDRVNVFAWGSGVVTAGYPYSGNPFLWTTVPDGPNPPNDDPNSHFINNFGGTSAATAMVAGAAALVQSYAKRELGQTTRYLMPLKMREILVNSGVPQTATDGCNIGMQPRVDEAMRIVDGFLAEARADYPELDSGELLTEERMIALRTLGIGIICKEFDPINSDSICPDEEIFPVGGRLAKDLDFDGDGRADLVQWTNGSWKLDLSSRGAGGDNFGAWDIEIEHEPVEGQWVWPYVIDMNRDGRTDFVVYDKEHGTWHIAFTNSALIRDGTWHGWDWEIDYSAEWTDTLTLDPFATDPEIPDARYSRPVPGDYNNDGWIDIAIACSDGNWRIDHGGPDRTDFGAFDRTVRYLSDAQLAEAPGWAYLAGPVDWDEEIYGTWISFKSPDVLADVGHLYIYYAPDFDMRNNFAYDALFTFGGNDMIMLFRKRAGGTADIGLKTSMGDWDILIPEPSTWDIFPSPCAFGELDCRPVSADFDGDGISDRAVMCPDEWRIAYSGEVFADSEDSTGLRRISLDYDTSDFSLPGRSYAGGLSYSRVQTLISFFQMSQPGIPPPIPVDMATVTAGR